jgi:hypothetical protein
VSENLIIWCTRKPPDCYISGWYHVVLRVDLNVGQELYEISSFSERGVRVEQLPRKAGLKVAEGVREPTAPVQESQRHCLASTREKRPQRFGF